jgi:hypothetical protein
MLQRDPVDKLSLEPPADLPAFVLSSYERLLQLPPVAFTWHSSDPAKGRVYVDGSGAVRFDRFTSAEATEPSGYRIFSDNRISGMALVESKMVWVEPGHEAIDDNAREYIRVVISFGVRAPGCEMARDPSAVDTGTAATGWRYVGVEYVAGRPTHHVTCGGGDLWLDIESRLIMRTREPLTDDAGQPIPGQFGFTEVTEIAFGEQPAALFEPPEGLARISADAYGDYICAGNRPNELMPGISDCPAPEEAEATPPPEPSPTPTPTPALTPIPSPCTVRPGDTGEPPGPLAWTRASLERDWPAPVRPEPAGGGSVQPMPLTYGDPTGDNGSDAYPCVDIRWVMADTSEVRLKLVSNPPPWSCPETSKCLGVDPTEQWIAYGVVTDEDGDGVPDWRYGIDNMPVDAIDYGPPRRGWRTNLHTGKTEAGPEHWDGFRNGGGFDSGLPPDTAGFSPNATFQFVGAFETTQGTKNWGFELDMPFYTWASVIVDGRVVATDYAPDSGWLVATPGVTPGGTVLLGDPYPHLSMTVPDGWTGDDGALRRGDCDGFGPCDVRFKVIDGPEDLCSGAIKPPLGSSFDDLVTYFADLPMIETSKSVDVTVGGFSGKHLQVHLAARLRKLANESGLDPGLYASVVSDAGCAEGPIADMLGDMLMWEAYDDMGEAYNSVWILDVDGVPVLIFSQSDTAEIRQIVESIHFER